MDGQGEKKFFADFALWKNAAPEHIMRWPSPWGEGFPGWHLECSAMSSKYLGEEFDIHGGGMDLKFPHHECEIAQNTATTGKKSVRYWIHGNMLTVNGQKMSKSLGNSFLPHELFAGKHELLDKGYSPMTVRFFMMQAHYRSTLDFSNDALQAAEKGFKRIMAAVKTLDQLQPSTKSEFDVKKLSDDCYAAMNDDFNAPIVMSLLFDAVRAINSCKEGILALTKDDIDSMKKTFHSFLFDILGLKLEEGAEENSKLTSYLMDFIIGIRADAKANKNFALSDKIRDELVKAGVQLKDTKEGVTWSVVE